MGSPAVAVPAFVLGAVVSLTASWILVSRIERIGQRLSLSQAIVGMLAALAGDSPEVTSAVTALAHHDRAVGAGVVIGSNVFNLAALLGLGAVVGGSIALHRRAVALSGLTASWVALVCLLAVLGALDAVAALVLALVGLVPYLVVLALGGPGINALPLPARWRAWLDAASTEEAVEAHAGMHPSGPGHFETRGHFETIVVVASLAVIVGASVAMEEAATSLGGRFSVPGIVVGGIVLAAVTSVPNAVAAVYLARRRRGVAVLSTALNSNTLNAVAGLLVPATVAGIASSPTALLVACWYVGLTAVALAYAYRDAALRRGVGALVIAAYLAFVVSLVVASSRGGLAAGVAVGPAVVAVLVAGSLVARRRSAQRAEPSAPSGDDAGAATAAAARGAAAAAARARRQGDGDRP